ncbi:helix-turn-helix domain-containing protein [Ferrimonas balearica]|uniref:YdaS family helix-turn-helix protein n=1 Tax=Ferrimonas balearica TaxID=44012 RepID=UPI001C980DC3|nr:helix-turn-helix domain-containing protein [Ferrimonas balearica]
MKAVSKAVKALGGQSGLARALSTRDRQVTQQAVWNWEKLAGRVPARYIRAVSVATSGRVTVEQLLKDHEPR